MSPHTLGGYVVGARIDGWWVVRVGRSVGVGETVQQAMQNALMGAVR